MHDDELLMVTMANDWYRQLRVAGGHKIVAGGHSDSADIELPVCNCRSSTVRPPVVLNTSTISSNSEGSSIMTCLS